MDTFGRFRRRRARTTSVFAITAALCALVLLGAVGPAAGVSTTGVGSESAAAVTNVTTQSNQATIEGEFHYEDRNGNARNARDIRVKLIHDNGVKGPGADPNTKGNLDTVLQKTDTNDQGEFSFTVDTTTGLGDHVRVYLMFVAKNDAAIVTNTAIRIRHGYASQVWNLGPGDTVTPTVSPDDDVKHQAFQAADAALTAYRFTQDKASWTRDRVRIQLPQTSGARYISIGGFKHISVPDRANSFWDNGTIYHEYGHAMLGELYGGAFRLPDISTYINIGPKGTLLFPCHGRASDSGRFYAMNEGFAEFMEAAVRESRGQTGSNSYWNSIENGRHNNPGSTSYTDDPWFNNGYTDPNCLNGIKGDGYDGNHVEGALASIILDIYDGKNERYDELDEPLRDILGTFSKDVLEVSPSKRNTDKSRTGHELWKFFLTDSNHEPLRKIFSYHGIQKPDRFEDNDDSGSAAMLEPNVTVDAALQNTTITDSIPSAGVPDTKKITDVDHYNVTLQEEQRATVSVDSGRWGRDKNGSMDLEVTGPSGWTPDVQRQDGNASVTFTAKETGEYNLKVDSTKGSESHAWYSLSLTATGQPPQDHEQDDTAGSATELELVDFADHRNTTELTAATARHDRDYYEIDLRKGHRINHAELTGAPGLNVTLTDGSAVVAKADNGEVMTTTTDPTGIHYFVVGGDGRTSEYTLNVTTQLISQKYEENDAESNAHDFMAELGLDDPPTISSSGSGIDRGTTACGGTDDSSSKAGDGFDVDLGTGVKCPRHNWSVDGTAEPGYSPHDPDWYLLRLDRDERVDVDVSDERLGVELRRNGVVVAETDASSDRTEISHIAGADGEYYVNVTGDEYVPQHDLDVNRVIADGQDQFELNDRPDTASTFSIDAGVDTNGWDLLTLTNGDVDMFQVEMESGDSLNATMTHLESAGDVDFTIVGPDGGVTQSSDPRPSVVADQSDERVKRAELTASKDGTYYVKAAAGENVGLKYNLTIRTDKQSAQTASDGPGFGVGVALVALSLVGWIAARRRS